MRRERIELIYGSIVAVLIKKYIDFIWWFGFRPEIISKNNNIVVSLTSYGRRVKDVVPYTIFWLYRQKIKPSRIILWLNKDNWNDDILPKRVKELIKLGLEVKYCKDLRSYTKLYYSLKICDNCPIVTLDDDMLYSSHVISMLLENYKEHPNSVSALVCVKPKWESQYCSLTPYHSWRFKSEGIPALSYFAKGFGGVLYPPKCFDDEVLNEDIFKRLCPLADDVWFWAMEMYSKRDVSPIPNSLIYYPSDSFYQYRHKGSALNHSNVAENENDKQINAVLTHYKLWEYCPRNNL